MIDPIAHGMEPGRLYCRSCDTDVFPAGPRQGEGHVAVRFRDDNWGIVVILDGQAVEDVVIEAFAAEHGWVIAASSARCPRCGQVGYEVRNGDVRIARRGGE